MYGSDVLPSFLRLSCGGLALALLTLAGAGCEATPTEHSLFINEFMADNETVISDENGGFMDWIEIYNGGEDTVVMDGYFITDDLTAVTKWAIPATLSIEAGGYLVLWASGDTTVSDFHLPFALEKNGEEIGLYMAEESAAVQVDAVSFGEAVADESAARETDGSDNWIKTDSPTPGAAN